MYVRTHWVVKREKTLMTSANTDDAKHMQSHLAQGGCQRERSVAKSHDSFCLLSTVYSPLVN